MKHTSYHVYIFIFFLIFSWHSSLLSSLIKGTLVKTPEGLVPIEQLKVGDYVISYGSENTLKSVRVLRITKEVDDSKIIINTEQGSFVASKDQLFYSGDSQWIKAGTITEDHALFDAHFQQCQCGKSTIIHGPVTIYKITVEFPHILFISDLQIATHNFVPVIVGISLAFGAGEGATITGLGLNMGALAMWKFLTGTKKTQITIQLNSGDDQRDNAKDKGKKLPPGGSPEDPEDKDKERKKNVVTKTEFFKKIKDRYEYWRDKIYKRKSGKESIEGAEYIQWDNQHQDIEAYSKSEKHMGSIDPQTLKLYKPAQYGRRFSQ